MTGDFDLRSLRGATTLVTGAGVSGRSAVRALLRLGAVVDVTDSSSRDAERIAGMGARFRPVDEVDALLPGYAVVVTSPGWRPDAPLLVRAASLSIPVWGDVELAWRLDQQEITGPRRRWLAITGTNGKTTTTGMTESIVRAAGLSGVACGNIGLPVIDALLDDQRHDVLAVELSSFQLHWAPSLRPAAGVVLNIAEDHLDWHGGMAAYTAAKARVLRGAVGVVGLDDPVAAGLAGGSPAGRTVGFTLSRPETGQLGVEDARLVDRAFGPRAELADVADVTPAGPPGLLDALAAAALTRAVGVPPAAVAAGLGAYTTGPHRAARVARIRGVEYVDDSKATNPHAARASILAHPRVVWIAGGLLKGARVDDLVEEVRDRLAGAVLLGRDRGEIERALSRHAPDVPVVEVRSRDDATVSPVPSAAPAPPSDPALAPPDRGTRVVLVEAAGGPDAVMDSAVREASALAREGDVVLLAPAAASLDMFADYGHRGASFTQAALRLAETS